MNEKPLIRKMREEYMKEEDIYDLITRLSEDAAPAVATIDLSHYEDYVKGDVYQYFYDISEKLIIPRSGQS